MKKLMIALGVVALAAASQAATFQWQVKNSYVYKAGSTSDHAVAGVGYLFDSSYAQATLLAAWAGGASLDTIASANAINKDAEGKFVGGTMANGQIAVSSKFTNPVENPNYLNSYFAVVFDGQLFISSVNSTQASALADGATIKFASQKDASQAAAKMAADGFKGAGWYTVPEPTSGLLLLLGVAGLALRRRRA